MLIAALSDFVVDNPLGFLVAFAAGMLSFLSPCVLPLVPGYLSLMSGLSSAELAEASLVDRAKVLRATLAFMAGFTAVFLALFLGASALHDYLIEHRVGFNRVGGVIVIFMGLFIAGVASPALLMRERRMHVSPSRLGVWAAPAMGAAFAFGWTPCIGPVLGAVLTVAAGQDTVFQGFVLLLAYSAGLGVPFIASGMALSRLAGVFSWVKRHFRAVNLVSGALLVVFGILLFTGQIAELTLRLSDIPGLGSF